MSAVAALNRLASHVSYLQIERMERVIVFGAAIATTTAATIERERETSPFSLGAIAYSRNLARFSGAPLRLVSSEPQSTSRDHALTSYTSLLAGQLFQCQTRKPGQGSSGSSHQLRVHILKHSNFFPS